MARRRGTIGRRSFEGKGRRIRKSVFLVKGLRAEGSSRAQGRRNMSRTISPSARSVSVLVALSIRGRKFDMELGVFADTVPAEAMLPLFRSFAETFIDLAVKEAEAQGKKITCQKGCGACCR